MGNFLKNRSVAFIEPTNLFEQLEERIVLDASIDPIPDQVITEDAAPNPDPNTGGLQVDAHSPAEDTGDATYGLNIDGVDVGVYNANNDPLAADIVFNSGTGEISWTPNNLDVGSYSFEVTATDNDPGNPAPWFDTEIFAVTVENTNDAPLLDNGGDPELAAVDEDDADPAGTLISNFLSDLGGSSITDVDAGALQGIAVIGVDDTNGSWQFDAGAGWQALNPAADGHRLLDLTSSVRFIPDAGFYGTVAAAMEFRAWDQTQGVDGGTWDTSVNGGTTAFSTDTDTASIVVNNTLDFTSVDHDGDTGQGDDPVMEDDAWLFDVQTDSETLGDNMTYSLTSGPPPGWISIDPDTGVMTGNPDNTHVPGSPYSFTIHAHNNTTGEDYDQTFTLTVTNDPPEFLNVQTDIYMTESSGPQNFDVQTDDEGISGAAIPYTLINNGAGDPAPGWLSIDPTTGTISGAVRRRQ